MLSFWPDVQQARKSTTSTKMKWARFWLEKCESTFCFLSDTATVEKVETLQQRVDELEKGIEIDKEILEDQIVAPKGSGRLTKKGNGIDAKRWSNHKWDFAKCEIGSDEFDHALEEGYEVFTQADRLAYMRKPREP